MIKENSVCDLCGNDYHIDLIIPDKLWEKHIHKGNFIVMACPHCIINRLSDSHKPYAFRLLDLSENQPSEREVLEDYLMYDNRIDKQREPYKSTIIRMITSNIDRYFAEKGVKND